MNLKAFLTISCLDEDEWKKLRASQHLFPSKLKNYHTFYLLAELLLLWITCFWAICWRKKLSPTGDLIQNKQSQNNNYTLNATYEATHQVSNCFEWRKEILELKLHNLTTATMFKINENFLRWRKSAYQHFYYYYLYHDFFIFVAFTKRRPR